MKKSHLTKKDYLEDLSRRLDSRWLWGQERYVGWLMGPIFCVTYYSGKEWGRRNYPIYNKAIGVVQDKKDGTEIRYIHFKGISDPINVMFIYILTVGIFAYVGVEKFLLYAGIWTIGVVIITFLYTVATEVGAADGEKLKSFLKPSQFV